MTIPFMRSATSPDHDSAVSRLLLRPLARVLHLGARGAGVDLDPTAERDDTEWARTDWAETNPDTVLLAAPADPADDDGSR